MVYCLLPVQGSNNFRYFPNSEAIAQNLEKHRRKKYARHFSELICFQIFLTNNNHSIFLYVVLHEQHSSVLAII